MALNDISKKIKHKSDQQWRTMANEQSASTSETATGEVYVNDPSQYTQTIAQGKNITITTAGNVKTINAVMGLLEGSNISISDPDSNGKVTITGTIAGKGISIADFTGKDGFVLTYNETLQVFELAEIASSYDLPQATETVIGGIKAKAKTTEASEVAIDTATGKLYGPAPDEAANGLPAGGTAGQIPSKIDGTDYNVEWVDPPTGGGGLIALPSYLSGTISSSAYAWKGNMFKPDLNVKLYAIGYIGNLVAGATYQAAVITKTAGNLIETITKSTAKTLPAVLSIASTKSLWLYFTEPIILTAGTTYYLMVGRTDSLDTYVLPIPFSGGTTDANAVPMMGLSHGNAGLIAKANPAIGDTINLLNTQSVAQYFLYESV